MRCEISKALLSKSRFSARCSKALPKARLILWGFASRDPHAFAQLLDSDPDRTFARFWPSKPRRGADSGSGSDAAAAPNESGSRALIALADIGGVWS